MTGQFDDEAQYLSNGIGTSAVVCTALLTRGAARICAPRRQDERYQIWRRPPVSPCTDLAVYGPGQEKAGAVHRVSQSGRRLAKPYRSKRVFLLLRMIRLLYAMVPEGVVMVAHFINTVESSKCHSDPRLDPPICDFVSGACEVEIVYRRQGLQTGGASPHSVACRDTGH